MRNAPKFLGPWERIDRLVDDLADEAHAEIKAMVAAALDALPPLPVRAVPYDYTLAALGQNLGMQAPLWQSQGMRMMTHAELQEMASRQMEGVRQSENPWLSGLGTTGGIFGYPFGR